MNPGFQHSCRWLERPRGEAYKQFTPVNNFCKRFLTNDVLEEFYTWLVKSRSESYSKSVLNYVRQPLRNERWSIKSYRLFLKFLEEKYNLNVDDFLKKLKIPRTQVDLKVPSDNEILDGYKQLTGVEKNIYLLLLSSGLRLKEIFFFINNKEKLWFTSVDDIIVYRIQLERGFKKAFYLFSLYKIIDSIDFREMRKISYKYYSKLCERQNIVRAKYVRKWVATKMFQLEIPETVINFIQGRTPRTVLQQHYLNLFSLSLKYYKKYAAFLKNFLQV